MRVVELFAGVGGFRIGFERASESFETVWSNQWEPSTKKQDASEIYQKWFGSDGYSNEDINLVKTEDIPDHDLLCGGFPCISGDSLVLTSDGYKYITDVKEGDIIVTSGVGGMFPAGLPVGFVNSVQNGEILVETIADISRAEYVRIVDYGLSNDDNDTAPKLNESK